MINDNNTPLNSIHTPKMIGCHVLPIDGKGQWDSLCNGGYASANVSVCVGSV